jgi:hypothetical protein
LVNYKGGDLIEFGYKNYAESSYGGSPGASATTLYRVGHVTELAPRYDPELSRLWALRDASTPAPLALTRAKETVGLRLTWVQGTLSQYAQDSWLNDHENWFAEAKIYRDAGNAVYLYWTGLKLDALTVRCGVGEPIKWTADLAGKLYDTKTTTIHSYGSSPGDPWEWKDSYVQVSADDSTYTTIPCVTDYEFKVGNSLHPVYVFNAGGSKQLTSLEEMGLTCSARLTMNLQDTSWLDYLVDQTELYLKLVLPDGRWLKLNKGKVSQMDPVVKPEDLVACSVGFEGRWVTNGW